MNNIKWTQHGTFRFVAENGEFIIEPNQDGRWVLFSAYKNKAYFYEKLESAFEGARNIGVGKYDYKRAELVQEGHYL